MQNWKKILYSVGMGVVACLIVVATGVLLWQLTAGQRRTMAEEYLQKADDYLAEDDGQALWELTKAYTLDLSYRDYRVKRALALRTLGDKDAEKELKEVIDLNWADDMVNFRYAEILLEQGKENEAVDFFKKVTNRADSEVKNEVLLNLLQLAGNQGKWEEAVGFRGQLIDLEKNNPEKLRYEAALSLVTVDLNDELKKKLKLVLGEKFSEEKYTILNQVNGDSYVVQAADWLLDLGLTKWGRNYLQQLDQTDLEMIDVYLLQAKSYWLEGKCALAADYIERTYQIDSTNEQVREWEELIGGGCRELK
ncbi:MAG: tetratricopeptide repeat protein [Patescibacteria group bacterium]